MPTNDRLHVLVESSGFVEARGVPPSEESLRQTEEGLQLTLPNSFKAFLLVFGAATFASGEAVVPPGRLGPLDVDDPDLVGLVPLVSNVGGTGDLLAFNPRDPEVAGERPVYLVSYEVQAVAPSFGAWLESSASAWRLRPALRRVLSHRFPKASHYFLAGSFSLVVGGFGFVSVAKSGSPSALAVSLLSGALLLGVVLLLGGVAAATGKADALYGRTPG